MPSDPVVLARLQKRDDDLESDNVVKRIARFEQQALPVVQRYEACPEVTVRKFDTNRKPQVIADEINKFIDE